MNDYVIYEVAMQRHAELADEARRSRTIKSLGYRSRWTSVTTSARQRFGIVAQVLTNRTRTPMAA